MPINPQALTRLEEASFTAPVVSRFIGNLAGMLDMTGATNSQIQLDYQHADDTIAPGDLIPFITIGLRPATVIGEEVPSVDS